MAIQSGACADASPPSQTNPVGMSLSYLLSEPRTLAGCFLESVKEVTRVFHQ